MFGENAHRATKGKEWEEEKQKISNMVKENSQTTLPIYHLYSKNAQIKGIFTNWSFVLDKTGSAATGSEQKLFLLFFYGSCFQVLEPELAKWEFIFLLNQMEVEKEKQSGTFPEGRKRWLMRR